MILRASSLSQSLVGLALALSASPALARIEATFAGEGPLVPALVAELGRAQRHVDVLVPDLREGSLVQKLRELAKAGRKVRVVVSRREEGLKEWECLPCTALEADGADLRYLELPVLDAYALVDGPRTPVGSGDKSRLIVAAGRLSGQGDATLVRFSAEGDYVLSYQSEFNHLWRHARDYGKPAKDQRVRSLRKPGAPGVFFTSAGLAPVPLAQGGWELIPRVDAKVLVGPFVAAALDQAYDSIDVAVRSLRRPEVKDALQRALGRGVAVRVLVDASDQKKGEAAGRQLAALGADVRYQGGIRSPLIVIDGKAVMTGSFGFGKKEETAVSSILALRGGVTATYIGHFDRQFAAAKAPYRKASAGLGKRGNERLCARLKLASANLEDMAALRKHIQKDDCR